MLSKRRSILPPERTNMNQRHHYASIISFTALISVVLILFGCGSVRRELGQGAKKEIGKTVATEVTRAWARRMAERELKEDSAKVDRLIEERLRAAQTRSDPKLNDPSYVQKFREKVADDIRECLVKKALESAADTAGDQIPQELKEKFKNCLD